MTTLRPHVAPDVRAAGAAAKSRPPAVLLVDDHDLFRAGLRTLLEGQGMRVVGDSRCDLSAIDMGRRTRATIALLDTSTVDGATTEPILEAFGEQLPDIGLVMFTRSLEDGDIYRSIRAGARAYVQKGAPVEQLAAAIRAVQAGAGWMPPPVIATVMRFIRSGVLPMTARTDMSDREVEVLRLVAEGLDNNEIARELGISAKTVKNHVSSILTKLQLTNRVQAAVFAVRSGIA